MILKIQRRFGFLSMLILFLSIHTTSAFAATDLEMDLSDTYWNTNGDSGVVLYNSTTDTVSMTVTGVGSDLSSGPNGMNYFAGPFVSDSTFIAEIDFKDFHGTADMSPGGFYAAVIGLRWGEGSTFQHIAVEVWVNQANGVAQVGVNSQWPDGYIDYPSDNGTIAIHKQDDYISFSLKDAQGQLVKTWSQSGLNFDNFMMDLTVFALGEASEGYVDYTNLNVIEATPASSNDGLVAYYPFNGNADDESGNGIHGTVNGGVAYVNGVCGQAANFDGIDDYISAVSPPYNEGDSFSFSLWIRRDDISSCENQDKNTILTLGKEFKLLVEPEPDCFDLKAAFSKPGTGLPDPGLHIVGKRASAPSNPRIIYTPAVWNHVVIMFDGNGSGTLSAYLNGAFIGSISEPALGSNWAACGVNGDRELLIGRRLMNCLDGHFYKGLIDEVYIYNRTLSDSEIQDLYGACSNHQPIANAGIDQSAHPYNSVTLDGSASSDPDQNYPLTYQWEFISKPEGSTAILSDPFSVNPAFTPDLMGDYNIRLVVTDSLGLSSAADTVLISTFNTPPVADAGEDQAAIQIGTQIFLDGSQSWDNNGDDLTYAWSFSQVPGGSTAALSDPASVHPTFIADVNGTYVLALVVSDPWSASDPDTVTISFNNVKPVADAGDNLSIIQGERADLDGSSSHDDNLDQLTYQWRFVSKPDGSLAVFNDPADVQPDFIADESGEYLISLVVNDGFIDSDPSNISVVAISYPDATTEVLQEAITAINNLDQGVFKNKKQKKKLTKRINNVIRLIDRGRYQKALNKLEGGSILKKIDGCANNGIPDKNDWIQDCDAQNAVYPLIIQAIELLENMI